MSSVPVDVSVVVPAFNEEETICEVIEKSSRGLFKAGKTGEIVVVNDGSNDHTQKRVMEKSREVHIVRLVNHSRNLGLPRALQTGLANARGELIIILPADLESNPEEDIPRLLAKMPDADMVSGWRQGRTGSKVVASAFYNFLYRSLFKIDVHDANWIKCFRRSIMDHIIFTQDWNRYLVLFAAQAGGRIAEVKVTYYKRDYGRSKFGLTRLPTGFIRFLKMYRETRRSGRGSVSVPSPT